MQDAFVGNWAQESHLSAEILGSLRDLNHRFLDLTASRTADWVAGRVASLIWAEVVQRRVTPVYIGTQGALRRRSTGSSLLALGRWFWRLDRKGTDHVHVHHRAASYGAAVAAKKTRTDVGSWTH